MKKDRKLDAFIEDISHIMPQVIQGVFRRQKVDMLTRGEISIPQYVLLLLLCKKKFMMMKDIASELNVSLPAASGMVTRLVSAGRVRRIPDEQDRRVVYIGVTSRGKQVVNTVRNQRKKVFKEVFKKIPERERTQYLNVLRKISKIIHNE